MRRRIIFVVVLCIGSVGKRRTSSPNGPPSVDYEGNEET